MMAVIFCAGFLTNLLPTAAHARILFVTIGNIDGVISRISIRATTLTTWERKEYLVPNKEFITGRVLNWTLSNAINRVVNHCRHRLRVGHRTGPRAAAQSSPGTSHRSRGSTADRDI